MGESEVGAVARELIVREVFSGTIFIFLVLVNMEKNLFMGDEGL